jgi:hypothetical protein
MGIIELVMPVLFKIKIWAGERDMLTVCPLYHLPKPEDETKKERGDRATSRHG